MAVSQQAQSDAEFKRLEFVRNYSQAYLNTAYDLFQRVYSNTKAYVPAQLKPTLEQVEEKVQEYGTPLLNYTQDKSEQVLHTLDKQVNTTISQMNEFYQKNSDYLANAVQNQRAFHEKNVEVYYKARENYLRKIEETVEFLKQHGISGTAKYAADSLLATVEQAKKVPYYLQDQTRDLLGKVGDAWEKLAQYPAVHKLVEAVQPSIDFAWQKYVQAHDTVVKNPTYGKLYKDAECALDKVTQTSIYKTAANNLYPVISPYADPALDKLKHSGYYNAVVDHVKPGHLLAAH